MATNRQRYMISVDDKTKQEIEDFRFSKRFNTMSEATQELIKLGLKAYKRLQDGDAPYVFPELKQVTGAEDINVLTPDFYTGDKKEEDGKNGTA